MHPTGPNVNHAVHFAQPPRKCTALDKSQSKHFSFSLPLCTFVWKTLACGGSATVGGCCVFGSFPGFFPPASMERHKNPEHDDKVGTKPRSHLNPDKHTAKCCRIAIFLCRALLKLIVGIFILPDKRAEMAVSSPDLSLQDVIRCFLCTARGGNLRKQVRFVHTLLPSQWKRLSECPAAVMDWGRFTRDFSEVKSTGLLADPSLAFIEIQISTWVNEQRAVSSSHRNGGKKGSETVSETHLLLTGQLVCENQASFHGQCQGNHTMPREKPTIAARTEARICSFDLLVFSPFKNC